MSGGAAKIYTKTGDKGKTSLIGGTRVSKSHWRLDAYGTIDELNSVMGLLIHDLRHEFMEATEVSAGADGSDAQAPSNTTESAAVLKQLHQVQHKLFNVGSQLACEDAQLRSQLPGIVEQDITDLEQAMDDFSRELKPLQHFILPGGSRSASVAHLARTVARRAERICVELKEAGDAEGAIEVEEIIIRYVNRLSDYFFVLARHLNRCLKVDEPIWQGKNPS